MRILWITRIQAVCTSRNFLRTLDAIGPQLGTCKTWKRADSEACREYGMFPYSRLISGLTRANVRLVCSIACQDSNPNLECQMAVDRKSLCILAETEPVSFKCVLDEAKRQGHE